MIYSVMLEGAKLIGAGAAFNTYQANLLDASGPSALGAGAASNTYQANLLDASGASGSGMPEVILQGIPVPPGIDLASIYSSPFFFSPSVWISGDIEDPLIISKLSNFNQFLLVLQKDFFQGTIQGPYIKALQGVLDQTSPALLAGKLDFLLIREYNSWYNVYAKNMGLGVPVHDWYVKNFGKFVPSPLEPLLTDNFGFFFIGILLIVVFSISLLLWRRKRKNFKCEESKPSCTGVPRQGPASSGSQTPDTGRRVPSPLSLSLLQPSFLMSKTRNYAQILIGSWLFLTAMAIYLSLWVAPLDFQQGGNSRILYVHVPVAWMSILVYIVTAINTFLFLLTKHPLFLRSSGTGIEMGAFFTLFTLVTGGFWGRPMWGTFWVWDARLTSVFILLFIYLGALCFQKLSVELASILICVGLIDIPIIKFSVNWWNTLHQPGSISRFGTSIHVSMLIPILSNFANFLFLTCLLFVIEIRLLILSFLESSLTEEIEAREGSLRA